MSCAKKNYCMDCSSYNVIAGNCEHPYMQLEYGRIYGKKLKPTSDTCNFFSHKESVDPNEDVPDVKTRKEE